MIFPITLVIVIDMKALDSHLSIAVFPYTSGPPIISDDLSVVWFIGCGINVLNITPHPVYIYSYRRKAQARCEQKACILCHRGVKKLELVSAMMINENCFQAARRNPKAALPEPEPNIHLNRRPSSSAAASSIVGFDVVRVRGLKHRSSAVGASSRPTGQKKLNWYNLENDAFTR